jgi:hypothetical protein
VFLPRTDLASKVRRGKDPRVSERSGNGILAVLCELSSKLMSQRRRILKHTTTKTSRTAQRSCFISGSKHSASKL